MNSKARYTLRVATIGDITHIKQLDPSSTIELYNVNTWVVAIDGETGCVVGSMRLDEEGARGHYCPLETSDELYVHPDHRRRGIGRLFLREVFQRHKSSKVMWFLPVSVVPFICSPNGTEFLDTVMSKFTVIRGHDHELIRFQGQPRPR